MYSSEVCLRGGRQREWGGDRLREREKMFGGAEEKPSILIMENRSSLLIRAMAFTTVQMPNNARQ